MGDDVRILADMGLISRAKRGNKERICDCGKLERA
jgi:hypothetical protein